MSGVVAQPRHHPCEATLVSQALGGLSPAHRLVVARHVAQCPDCRGKLAVAEMLGGVLLDELPMAPLDPDGRTLVIAALDAVAPADAEPSASWLDSAIAAAAGRSWRWLAPGIRHRTLFAGPGGTLHLLRVRVKKALPHHAHGGLELTLVLEGGFCDGAEHYLPGDLGEADQTGAHRPVAEGTQDCVCLIATTGRLRFSGWIARLLQPLLPF